MQTTITRSELQEMARRAIAGFVLEPELELDLLHIADTATSVLKGTWAVPGWGACLVGESRRRRGLYSAPGWNDVEREVGLTFDELLTAKLGSYTGPVFVTDDLEKAAATSNRGGENR